MKTVQIDEKVHLLMMEKQIEIYKKTGRMVTFTEIAEASIISAIDAIDNCINEKTTTKQVTLNNLELVNA